MCIRDRYTDDPSTTGLITTDTVAVRYMLQRALKAGVQVEIHAIGDRGNRLTLDLFEAAFNSVPVAERKIAEPRWRVEHAQIVAPSDLPRFKSLGLIASMQPSHAIGDLFFVPSRIGVARTSGAYAWESFLKMGVPVAGGTDAIPCNPMMNVWSLVTRRDRVTSRPVGKHGSLSVPEAIKVMTTAGARLTFEEDCKGPLVPGNRADIAFLARDPLRVDIDELPDIKCEATLSGGEFVYGNVSRDTPEPRDSI